MDLDIVVKQHSVKYCNIDNVYYKAIRNMVLTQYCCTLK